MKLSLIVLIASLALSSADIYDNCGTNGENCFAIPPFLTSVKTCIARRTCKVVASFNRVSEGIQFEIEAKYNGVDDGSHWVGLGFSTDGGRAMGEDSVVACYGSTVANYWNTIPFWSVPLQVNVQINVMHFKSHFLQDGLNGLSAASVTVADGKISCSFIKDAVTEFTIPDHDNVVIDLDNQSYFLELATGPLGSDGNISPHKDKKVSDEAIEF